MKISENWLREWVDVPLSGSELAQCLTMAGHEVEAVEPAAPAFVGVRVAEVLSVAPHPQADRLRMCQVSVAEGEPRQIVCGAPNVVAGMRAPVALPGARLPGGKEISATELRGVASQGMLCSARELGLGDDSSGLMVLPAALPVGQDLREALALDDLVIDVDLTPNRGDCLSIAGVAREISLLTGAHLTPVACDPVRATSGADFPVELRAPGDCPRYVGRVIRGVDPTAQTPVWMVERLRRAGVRPLGPLVDVTNYVMLELGQPMHAFDLAHLQDGIVVRRAAPGEGLTLLDGSRIELDPDVLLIADHHGPLALAGIMGGEGSGCSDDTRDVFLESAFFSPLALVGRARRFGLHTESSHRFERGVDPELQRPAMERATSLLLQIAGGAPGPVIEALSETQLPQRKLVSLRRERLRRLLGSEVPGEKVSALLGRLATSVTESDSGWEVMPPSYRFDITLEVDLIEEVARIEGYERLPSARPRVSLDMSARPESLLSDSRLRATLVDHGYHEAITYSFVDPTLQAMLDPEREPIPLANPISSDLAVMRTSLWPGLVGALRHNLARQQPRVRLFETGMVFLRDGDQTRQPVRLGGLVSGSALGEQWAEKSRPVDFFDLKGDLEAVLAVAGPRSDLEFVAASHPALHPGQCAEVHLAGQAIGWIGALHPDAQRALDIGQSALVFEIDYAAAREGSAPSFRELSRFPSLRRDLALVVEESVSAEQIRRCVREAEIDLVRDLVLFDLYRGPGIENGRKSLAIGLILQADSRTLTDSEVDAAVQRLVARLGERFGATLRV
jgi:phenylalanyl-tRNA synthetase beta chain